VSLVGRTAVVTGGASGIGRSICLHLARAGADVAVLDLDLAGGERVAAELAALGRRALTLEVDVAQAASVGSARERVHAALGRVHILVNDAGIAGFAPLLQMTEEAWDRMIAVHLKGTFNCTRAFLPDMVEAGWGRVINISSVAGLRGGPNLAHYAAAKAGILGFTKALAIEVGAHGVTVNAVAPGLVDTPMLRRSGWTDEMSAAAIRQAPIKRIGEPDDVAAACAFLASSAASFFTGQVLSPNGGGHL
jgi:NAD(P)-dependent dehydrogenase (short-subunit alcohol dehydrogenase family)